MNKLVDREKTSWPDAETPRAAGPGILRRHRRLGAGATTGTVAAVEFAGGKTSRGADDHRDGRTAFDRPRAAAGRSVSEALSVAGLPLRPSERQIGGRSG